MAEPISKRQTIGLTAQPVADRAIDKGSNKLALSTIGTKRTSLVAPHMSAFGGKADMEVCIAHVCF